MEIGLFLHTHGLVARRNGGAEWTSLPTDAMRVDEVVRLAERLGFASVWLADHVATTRREYDGRHELTGANRMRPAGCVMLDSLAVMAFIAAHTDRIGIGTSVLVAPYRHPLVTAQQLATIDVLSGGRDIAGIGAGWLKSEFDALGLNHEDRFAMTDEVLQILDQAWQEPWVTYQGRFYDFADVAVEPKPLQRPRIPLIYGGSTPAGARRALRLCDGFSPRLAQEADDPPAQLDPLRAALAREATRLGRDLASFRMSTQASCQLEGGRSRSGTPFLHGSSGQVLDDLAALGARGCSRCTFRVDVSTGAVSEYIEQLHQIGDDVVPHAAELPVSPL